MREQHKFAKLNKFFYIIGISLLLIIPSVVLFLTRKPATSQSNHNLAIALTTELSDSKKQATSGTGYLLKSTEKISNYIQLENIKKQLETQIEKATALIKEPLLLKETKEKLEKLLLEIDNKKQLVSLNELKNYLSDLENLTATGEKQVTETKNKEEERSKLKDLLAQAEALQKKESLSAETKAEITVYITKANKLISENKANVAELKAFNEEFKDGLTKLEAEVKVAESANAEKEKTAEKEKKITEDTTWFKSLTTAERREMYSKHTAVKLNNTGDVRSVYGTHGIIFATTDGYYICPSNPENTNLFYPFVMLNTIKAVYESTADAREAGYKDIQTLPAADYEKIIKETKQAFTEYVASTSTTTNE
ncbi:MAG: hypothetical protein LBM95_04745 [Lactobacillales bacterium]|jgi:chemotaxis protein histidine kinase CheA|nr:hypothetical protein [Lactobacillales bacterium]